jgi:hypothetical protein
MTISRKPPHPQRAAFLHEKAKSNRIIGLLGAQNRSKSIVL